jgi:hypothetical protein
MIRPPMRALALGLFAVACSEDRTNGADAGVTDAEAPPVWVVEPGVPTKEDLLAIWGDSATDIWAVGFAGTIIHYDGLAWTNETTTATLTLTSVHGIARNPMAMPPEPLNPLFAVGWNGTILARDHAAGTWFDAAPTSTITEDLFDLAVGSDDSAVAVGDSGRVMVWDGMVWDSIRFRVPGEFSGSLIEPKTTLQGIWTGNGSNYYVIGSGGAAYRSDGGYNSWSALDTLIAEPLRGIWGAGNSNVFAVGLDALILHYTGEWRRIQNNGAGELPRVFFFGIDGIPGEEITIVGWRGVVARFDGSTWFAEPSGIEADLRDVWIDPVTKVAYAVGASGTVIRRDPPPPITGDAGL